MASPEFDAALALTEWQRDKADWVKSMANASELVVGYQARAEKAEAALARVSAAVGALLKLQYKAFEDAEAGYRGADGYADAYENAGRLITDGLEPTP